MTLLPMPVRNALGEIVDAEDVALLLRGAILVFIALAAVLTLAAAAGLAWSVFRLTGGL